MRLIGALGAAVVLVCAAGATASADGPPSGAYKAAHARARVCNCPALSYRWTERRHHYRQVQARQIRSWTAVAPIEPLDAYNPVLPSPYDTAYDRAMVLHFRSPAVTDTYIAEPGFPPTPPVAGAFPYRVRAWGAVYEYDGMIGQYVALAQSDARRILPASLGGW